MPTLTWNVRVAGIRLGRNLPHTAGRLHLQVVAEGDLDRGVARAISG